MSATRRHPKLKPVPKIPPLQPTEDPNKSEGITRRFLQELAATVESIRAAVGKTYASRPATHGHSHSVGAGDQLDTPGAPVTVKSDATAVGVGTGPAYMYEDAQLVAETATPSNATGAAAAQGSSSALMRADATIKQGIVEHKGALVTYDTAPVELTVGTDGYVLTADSTQAKGVKWAAAGGGAAAEEFHPFLLIGA